MEPLTLDAGQTARTAEPAPVVEGKPDMTAAAARSVDPTPVAPSGPNG